MGTLSATVDEVKRWRREGRYDILRYESAGDLWVDSERDDRELERCPFVRKVRGQNRYLCTIYETRPQVCRDYVPWSGKENDICEVVDDEILTPA
jgi:Fe-S-cluster containining protein